MSTSGKDGVISLATTEQASLKDWSIDLNASIIDHDVDISDTWMTRTAHILSGTGQFSFNWTIAEYLAVHVQILALASIAIALYPTDTTTASAIYSGSGYLSVLSLSKPIEGTVNGSCQFVTTGVWAAGAVPA